MARPLPRGGRVPARRAESAGRGPIQREGVRREEEGDRLGGARARARARERHVPPERDAGEDGERRPRGVRQAVR